MLYNEQHINCKLSFYNMIINIILLVVILLLLNNIDISFINNIKLFTLNKHNVNFYDIILFALFVYLIGFLPRPFKEIVGVILFLWLLSLLGILVIGGLSNIILIALIVVLIFSIFRK